MARVRTLQNRRKQIFIVEDHPLFCDGLRELLNHDPELRVCGTAASATEALAEIRRLKPDVVILDIGLPDRSGFELIRDIVRLNASIAILVVSAGDEMIQASRALRAGAKGYVMKHEGPDRLLGAVHQVLANRTSVSPRVTNQILKSLRNSRRHSANRAELSPRERQVLCRIGDGHNSAEIARDLGISRKTVDAYRAYIRRKLGLADGHQLIYYAVRWRNGAA
jgi:DNA-binding NarL/FixJ family response regulator